MEVRWNGTSSALSILTSWFFGARLTQNPRTELAPHNAGHGFLLGLTVICPSRVMVPAGDEVSQTQHTGPSP